MQSDDGRPSTPFHNSTQFLSSSSTETRDSPTSISDRNAATCQVSNQLYDSNVSSQFQAITISAGSSDEHPEPEAELVERPLIVRQPPHQPKLRFREERDFQVFHFQRPSVTIEDIVPVPTDRVPSKSCLKKGDRPTTGSRVPEFSQIRQETLERPASVAVFANHAHGLPQQVHRSETDVDVSSHIRLADWGNVSTLLQSTGSLIRNLRDGSSTPPPPTSTEITPVCSNEPQLRPSSSIRPSFSRFSIHREPSPEAPSKVDSLPKEVQPSTTDIPADSKDKNQQPEENWFENERNELKKESTEPSGIDYWLGTSYDRNHRRVRDIDLIFALNRRRTKNHESIKKIAANLLIVELIQDRNYKYAKCFTNSEFPVPFVIVPFNRFPEGEYVYLGTNWTAEVEYVSIRDYRRHFCFARVVHTSVLTSVGPIGYKMQTRTIRFGSVGSSFYAEMLVLRAPMRHVRPNGDEALCSYLFGEVKFNRRVLDVLPSGVEYAQGTGWIEPKPNDRGVFKDELPHTLAFLLVEKFEVEMMSREPFENQLQMRSSAHTTKPVEYVVVREPEQDIPRVRRPKAKKADEPKPPRLTREGQFDTDERRSMCEELLHNISFRTSQIFDPTALRHMADLLKIGKKQRRRLGELAEFIVKSNLLKEDIFDYLKGEEPKNLEDIRQMIKLTIDHAPEARSILGVELANWTFPIEEDPGYEP